MRFSPPPSPVVPVDLDGVDRALLAVSGGPDSLALLLLVHAQRPGMFAVATFDHGLRPEAATEAAFVARLCGERGIPHWTLRPARALDLPPTPDSEEAQIWQQLEGVFLRGGGPRSVTPRQESSHARQQRLLEEAEHLRARTRASGNIGDLDSIVLPKRESLQARARTARYDALAAHARAAGCDAIVTAHHRDDQAETFLMRASRGSGVNGLAGVRDRMSWNGLAVRRPLLDVHRASLARIVSQAGITPIDDPSNADAAYDRTRFRKILADNGDLKVDGFCRSAAAVADAADALDWMAGQLASERVATRGDRVVLDVRELPRELRRRLLIAGFRRLGRRVPRGTAIEGAFRSLERGLKSSLGDLLVEADADGLWILSPAPPRRSH